MPLIYQPSVQKFLPLLPQGAVPVNNNLAIFRDKGEITFFNGYCAMYKCDENDSYALRLAQGILCSTDIVNPAQLAKALGVNRSTVCRNKAIYQQGGASALVVDKAANRGAYRLDKTKLKASQKLFDKGVSMYRIAKEIGVVEGTIRYWVRRGALVKKPSSNEEDLKTASQRSVEDCQSDNGIGVKREMERTLASALCANEGETPTP
jgi:transposase-like protein